MSFLDWYTYDSSEGGLFGDDRIGFHSTILGKYTWVGRRPDAVGHVPNRWIDSNACFPRRTFSMMAWGSAVQDQLGLAGMARAFAELDANPTSTALSHAEWLALLLDREVAGNFSLAFER